MINWLVIGTSATLCLLMLPTRLPGMELLGIGPHWLLIWVVAWSVKRNAWQGAIAGITLGLIQDGLTAADPSHVFSLALVGILTARMQKARYIQEDFISISLIVFGMVIVSETVNALQYGFLGFGNLADIWNEHQRIALSSAILSSLWAPVICYPLTLWWDQLKRLDQSVIG
jgi:rod shape-determining protein MreD